MRHSNTATTDPPLGECPACEAAIPPGNLLIAYDTPDDWPRMLSRCPDCEDVVSPV